MKIHHLRDFVRGWFIGDFEPSLLKTDAFEAAVKGYKKGDQEKRHCHRVATEITVIASGRVRMNDQLLGNGDIIILKPGDSSDFECLSETALTMVIKYPCVKNDKFAC